MPAPTLLVVGGGGREHALAWSLRREAPDAEILTAPGNPGIAGLAECIPAGAGDIDQLARLVRERNVDLTVVGPEAPLAAGLVDRFEEQGLAAFGPSRAAARLESSKLFAKQVMRDAGVPTAHWETFSSAGAALEYVDRHMEPLVVKASGLAAGKGAIVCETREEARAAVRSMLVEKNLGSAGAQILIEECMTGPELSIFFLCDGHGAYPLLTSRDYKRVGEGDQGPNTGGMGAYSPAGAAGAFAGSVDELVEIVRIKIAMPVIEAMAAAGTPYRGFLYAGLMLTGTGPRVVEFNCRLGDPEAQVVLPLTISGLIEPMAAAARGEPLGDWEAGNADRAALTTILASAGYPASADKGRAVELPDFNPEEVIVFHSGTATEGGRLVTAGGRVLAVTGFGDDLDQAARRSRRAAGKVRFDGRHYRTDIGWHETGHGSPVG